MYVTKFINFLKRGNSVVNIGIIGAGYWGTNVIRTFANLKDCNLKYVADVKPGRRKFIRDHFPNIIVVEDYKKILEDEDIHAVVIVTNIESHFEIAIDSINAGKHIYVEKPLAERSDQAKEIINLAKLKQKKILVGHLFVYHPVVEEIKKKLDSRIIGDIYYIDAQRMNLPPPATKVNIVWDLAPHDISIIYYLLDETPEKVVAFGECFRNQEKEDCVYFRLIFKNRIANVHLSWLTPNKTRRMTLFGSKGVIVYDDMEVVDKIRIYEEGIDTRKSASAESDVFLTYKPGRIVIPPIPSGQPLDIECKHFIDCIKYDADIKTGGEDGFLVVKTIELINKSIKLGGKILSFKDNEE